MNRQALSKIGPRLNSGLSKVSQPVCKCVLRERILDRSAVFAQMQKSFESKEGFAFGKIGATETAALFYGKFLQNYTLYMRQMGTNSGLFPVNPGALEEWVNYYAQQTQATDIIAPTFLDFQALSLGSTTWKNNRLTSMHVTEPVRMHPVANDESLEFCYTKLFRDRRILVVNPIASFLCERATSEIFHRCWGNLPWWQPSSMIPLDIPNATDGRVREKFGQWQVLQQSIESDVERLSDDFDIALIGAAMYSVPLSLKVKSLGKLGIVLGGHLQVLFGVYGERWAKAPAWKTIINEHWVRPPDHLRPSHYLDQESGCYW